MTAQINLRSLHVAPEFEEKLHNFVRDHFPSERQCSRQVGAADEFPILLSPENATRILFLESNNEIIATCSWAPFQFDFGGSILKVAALGLISTHPDHRNKGLSNYLINEAKTMANKENAALSVLWSNLREHYENIGYMISGFEHQWKISRGTINKLSVDSTLAMHPLHDMNDIAGFYKKQGLGPQRSWDMYQRFLKLPDTFCVKGPSSYAFMGKARDLHNCVHEIYANKEELPTLLHRIAQHLSADEMSVLLPSHSPMLPLMTELFGEGAPGAFAFAKVLNGPSFVEKLGRASDHPSDLKIDVSGESFSIRKADKEIFASTDFSHFLQLFMGPLKVEDFEDLEASQKAALSEIKVPPIYFWGFDSV